MVDDAKDGKKGDEKGAGDKAPDGYVPKADYDKIVSDQEKLKQDLEEVRLEVLTPDYLEYLQGGKKKAEDKPAPKGDEPDFSKMSPGEIYKRAKEDALKDADAKSDGLRKEFSTKSEQLTQREYEAFARTHEDFGKFKYIMHGISLEPKNANMSLQELYDSAKVYVKGLGPTDEDKKKSGKSASEKPGGSSSSQQKDKKYTPESAAEEAWNESVGEAGFPTA